MSKNYIGFVNDHSGSMANIARAAMMDYNTNITAIKDAASKEMLDTVVSVVGIGYPRDYDVTRQVVISNPHVLKPITSWSTNGGTPLYDGIGNLINLFKSLPDAQEEHVSFLVMVTTDGEEMHSRKWTRSALHQEIVHLQSTGRWTFVFRIPANALVSRITDLGVPLDNIQKWDTTSAGMAQSTVATTQAMTGYFAARSAGAKSSSAFYSDASKVNLAALDDISKEVSLYVVPQEDNGIEIRPFILRHRMEHLYGSAFYQLTKTESRVQPDKKVLVRDQATGKVFAGKEARKMIGLPDDKNARLHPGDHKAYDIFIQSNSINRKLVGGTGVLYWKKAGRPFTDADLAYLQPKPVAPTTPPVVQLPKVAPTNKPTKSPIPVTPRMQYFETREEARRYCASVGLPQSDIQNLGKQAQKGRRWAVPTK